MINKHPLISIFLFFVIIMTNSNLKAFSDENGSILYASKNNINYTQGTYELSNRKTIMINGIKRSYYIFLPPNYNPQKSYPMLFVFHGGFGNANSILKITNFRYYQNKYDFILIAPNGSGRFNKEILLTWNAGRCGGFARDSNAKDTKFIDSIIEQTAGSYNIDRTRVYLTGLSNGAMLSYKIASQLSGKIAGFAPVCGSMNYLPSTPKNPIPVIIFHGTADRHVLYKGGVPLDFFEEKTRIDKPVSAGVDFWVKNNKCNPIPIRTKIGNIIIDKYINCENNANVILYTIVGGKHAWPGGKKDYPLSDSPTQEINASKIILDAFIENIF